MKGVKMLICGIIIGVTAAGAVSAGAASMKKVQAELAETVEFVVDGKPQELPSDMYVIHFADRNYVSARFIAESLGASVTWDEKTETVYITSAPPVVIEKPPATVYYSLPQRLTKENLTIEINRIEPGSYGHVYLDFLKVPEFSTMLDYDNATIEFPDGTKVKTLEFSNNEWLDSITPNKQGMLVFSSIPKEQTKFKLTLPFIIDDFTMNKTYTVLFSFNIDLSLDATQ